MSWDIYEAFDELFEESIKLKKVNSSPFEKLHEFKLENESLKVKLEESIRKLNKLRVEKEPLEIKALTSDLEKSSAQL